MAPSRARGRTFLDIEPFALIAAVLWGSSFPVTQVALRGFSPFASAFWRTIVGLAFLAIVSFWTTRTPVSLRHLRWAQWWRLAVLSVLATAAFLSFLNYSIQNAGPIVSAFIVTTYPALTLLLAPFVVHEHPPLRRVISAAVSIAGAFLLLGGVNVVGGQPAPHPLLGGVLAFGASVSFAFYLVLTRRWTHRYRLDARTIALFGPIFSTVPLFLLALFGSPTGFGAFRLDSILAVIALGVFCTGVAYLAMNHSLRRREASNSSMPLLVNPVVASVESYFVFGTQLAGIQWLGAIIALAGMFGANI